MDTHLFECLSLTEGGPAVRVDRAAGVISQVKILGYKSANGREYLKDGVSAALYEGRRVCAGHHRSAGERDPRDTYAVLEGVRVLDSGVFADRLRLLNPAGDFEQRLLTAAETAPSLFGLSHSARGREKPNSGGRVIESVLSVESVDLVCDPATVAGLYESRGRAVKKTVTELIEELSSTRPEYARGLREAAEAGVMGPEAAMDVPPPAAEGGVDHEQAILDAAKACLDDSSLNTSEKMKKIRKLLKIVDGGNAGSDAGESAAEESRRAETANLREENASLKAREALRAAADAAGVKLGKTLLESVRADVTPEQIKSLIDELKGAAGASQRPRSAAPAPPADAKGVRESKSAVPPAGKDRVAWLARGK